MKVKLDRLNTVLQEKVAGVRLIKVFVRANFEGEHFEAANEAFTDNSVRVMRFMANMSPELTVCVNIGMVIVIWAGRLAAIQDQLTVGQIVQLPAHHHDAAHHDDHALECVGQRQGMPAQVALFCWLALLQPANAPDSHITRIDRPKSIASSYPDLSQLQIDPDIKSETDIKRAVVHKVC